MAKRLKHLRPLRTERIFYNDAIVKADVLFSVTDEHILDLANFLLRLR